MPLNIDWSDEEVELKQAYAELLSYLAPVVQKLNLMRPKVQTAPRGSAKGREMMISYINPSFGIPEDKALYRKLAKVLIDRMGKPTRNSNSVDSCQVGWLISKDKFMAKFVRITWQEDFPGVYVTVGVCDKDFIRYNL